MLLSGAEILIECLLEQNVDLVFGYPGGAVLNIYDELYKYSDKINHILTCHEQGAAHAADGYARSTGKTGVVIATSGPGATNLVTGIATAYMDSIPMVAITGNVSSNLLGKDSFQEVDITGITMPITKHNYIVKNVEDLADTIREAFFIATDGRPGPVLVDITKDVTQNRTNYVKKFIVNNKEVNLLDSQIENAIDLINNCKRPMIFTGGGTVYSGASKELRKLAEKLNCPVATSIMGIGGFPTEHKLYAGILGMHGTKASNISAMESDLLIAIGTRFSDRVVSKAEHFEEKTRILHIDIDEAEIDKNVKAYSYIVGDIKEILNKIFPHIDEKSNIDWKNRFESLKDQKVASQNEDITTPKYVLDKLHEITKGEAIICTDVGQHQMWTAQYYKFSEPRTFISSGGLGTMGYGLGAAIGAQFGNPDKKVVNISGDGSFMMNCNELTTAVKNDLPVIVIIMNNNSLGMVKQWQSFFYEGRHSNSVLNRQTDFVKLAEAHGALGFRINSKNEVESVLKEALDSNRTVVIDCLIEESKKVFPMVKPGAPISDIIFETDV